MNRIEELRLVALNRKTPLEEFHYRFFKKYKEKTEMKEFEHYANAFYYMFSTLTPHITDGELIVGECTNGLSEAEQKEWEAEYRNIAMEEARRAGGGQDSHMAIDYSLLLSHGIKGIIKRIDGYLTDCENNDKADFYNACKLCLKAVVEHSHRYAELARALAESAEEERKAELIRIAEICMRVPEEPARSFYEAVQSVHFVTYCISLNPLRMGHQQFQLGRPDRYLLPYYEQDIKNGDITPQYAQLLLDCLGIQINMRVPNGLSSGYMVGGRDGEGNIVANDLTEMLMRVIDDIRLVYPSVGLCYTNGMNERYLDIACEILSHGRSHPAIFNDDIIAKGMIHYGIPENEARDYIHSTCVEITPIASSNVWVASPYTNMAQMLLDTMSGEYGSFEEHVHHLLKCLDESIRRNFEAENAKRRHRAANSMNPLLSCFVRDCLSRGCDIERGGAVYNWIMPSFVGMANLVDSLYVIKTVVYDRKELSLSELYKAINSNFVGYEELRFRLLNSIPKYGNDIDDIDGMFGQITEHIIEECGKYQGIHTNGKLIPSVFCWVMHERFGRETGATPDGRLAGLPLGDGSGPCQGRELNGPTASILSSTKWEHYKLIGGVAVNMKFSKSSLGESSLQVMQSLIKAYLEHGGFEMQINVIDGEVLKRAMEYPEEYRDLVVRIGGYSDYFTSLKKPMQDNIIARTIY